MIAAIVGCLSLQACGSMLYSETRDGQGKAAKEAWGKVDLAGQTSIARQNLTQLQATRQATIDQNELFRRNALALSLGKASDETIQETLARTQETVKIDLSGIPCDNTPVPEKAYCSLGSLRTAWTEIVDGTEARKYADGLRSLNAVWETKASAIERAFGSPLPTCTEWLDPQKKLPATWKKKEGSDPYLQRLITPELGDSVTDLCGKIQKQEQARNQLITGRLPASALAAAITRYDTLRSALAARKAKASQKTQPVEEAMAEVATAKAAKDKASDAKASETEQKALLATLQMASDKLAAAVTLLADASEKLPDNDYLKSAVAELKQESLNDFLKSIQDAKPGEAPPADTGKAAAAVILFADYFDQNTKRFKQSDEYGLAGIVLERKLAELEQARVQRAIAVDEQRVELAKRIVQVLELQLESYVYADAFASKAIKAAGTKTFRTFMVGKEAATVGTRKDVAAAIARLSEGGITHAADLDRLKAQENALERLNALTSSEMSLQAWNTLIGSNVDQLAVWAGSGIKQEQISQLINNLAAVFIAYGVNK